MMMSSVVATAEPTYVPQTTEEPAAEPIKFETFLTSAPKELGELLTKNGVKDFETLNKSYSGLNSLIGKKGLIKPAEGASEAEIAAYQEKLYAEIGVPADGKYEYKIPETIPEDAVSQEFLDSFAATAKEVGVSKDKFQKLIDVVYDAYGKTLVAPQDGQVTIEQLKKEWGKDYNAKAQTVDAFYKNVMKNDPSAEAAAQKFGNDPDFLKFAYNIAASLKEDKLDTPYAQTLSTEDIKKSAIEKTQQAMAARNKGDYITAEKLQKEIHEMYSKII